MGNASSTTISGNRIYDFQTTVGATGPIGGIEFDGASAATPSITVVNNMVSLAPTLTTAQVVTGIKDFAFGGNTFNAFYNSVYVGGTAFRQCFELGLTRPSLPLPLTRLRTILLSITALAAQAIISRVATNQLLAAIRLRFQLLRGHGIDGCELHGLRHEFERDAGFICDVESGTTRTRCELNRKHCRDLHGEHFFVNATVVRPPVPSPSRSQLRMPEQGSAALPPISMAICAAHRPTWERMNSHYTR